MPVKEFIAKVREARSEIEVRRLFPEIVDAVRFADARAMELAQSAEGAPGGAYVPEEIAA